VAEPSVPGFSVRVSAIGSAVVAAGADMTLFLLLFGCDRYFTSLRLYVKQKDIN
jgi:hypothetical protein